MMKLRKLKKENVLFFISFFIAILFFISPILLKCSWIESTVSCMLSSLKREGYKSSYVETLGAIFGSFLAITGALWTQRRIDLQNEKHIIKEAAVIIYYDLKFVMDDIEQFKNAYVFINQETNNKCFYLECFCNYWREHKIYIDSDWICNVAKLCNKLSNDEMKLIYKTYGDFETMKCAFEKSDMKIDKK